MDDRAGRASDGECDLDVAGYFERVAALAVGAGVVEAHARRFGDDPPRARSASRIRRCDRRARRCRDLRRDRGHLRAHGLLVQQRQVAGRARVGRQRAGTLRLGRVRIDLRARRLARGMPGARGEQRRARPSPARFRRARVSSTLLTAFSTASWRTGP
jgi:hypothetical protein